MTRGRLKTSQTFTPHCSVGAPSLGVGWGKGLSPSLSQMTLTKEHNRGEGMGENLGLLLWLPSQFLSLNLQCSVSVQRLRHQNSFLHLGRTSILLPVERVWSRWRCSPVLGLLLGTRGTPSSMGRKSSKLEARETSWLQGSPDQPIACPQHYSSPGALVAVAAKPYALQKGPS